MSKAALKEEVADDEGSHVLIRSTCKYQESKLVQPFFFDYEFYREEF